MKTKYKVVRSDVLWTEIVEVDTKTSAFGKAKYFADRYGETILVTWLENGRTRVKEFLPPKKNIPIWSDVWKKPTAAQLKKTKRLLRGI